MSDTTTGNYADLQRVLLHVQAAMDDLSDDMALLRRIMANTAVRVDQVADAIADADVDQQFVGLTQQVAEALGSAVHHTRNLSEAGGEAAAQTAATRRMHASMYGALDQVRTGRKHKTPKPGFFAD
ncbi:hypothetical protein C6N75_18490 [Streptomyces solincola]|uniref:Conjugal transfer protein TraB n=1 Tax=Streptomyces solincola TaxID=2100817 RepID=A0A2S9PTN9_9ACTN|nr:hypothetical protein [Streptomyces solincola]PRH77774.1 hypothetical protein C6N75_18490 [Streptomyces solincola]